MQLRRTLSALHPSGNGENHDLLCRRSSLKAVAENVGISLRGVNRVLNALAVPKPATLLEAISFDEFKENLGGERFQCIVTDPLRRRVLDILPKRTVESMQDYLRAFHNRDEVKYAVMDMNRGFRDVARTFFPNAKIIIDRFHVVRFCTQAMDNVRRSVQKQLPADQRRYFKRSRRLLLHTATNCPTRTRLPLTSCSASPISWRGVMH